MILKKMRLMVVLLLVTNHIHAQEIKVNDTLIYDHGFYSKTIGKQQQLQVRLPENSHKNTTTTYPVLYLIDGQNWFPIGVSIQKVFTGSEVDFKSMPDFIVVGITTNWKDRRDFFGSNNIKNAIHFIENEVIHYVDKHFRTSTERILFGWQFAGGFVMNVLAEKPEIFTGYLAATPVFYNPDVLDKLLTEQKNLNRFLYLAGTKEEKKDWIKPTLKILNQKAPKSFNWIYKEIAAYGSFGHRISPIETISYGLRAYFYDYPILEFKNVNAFYEKGGINYVKTYYEKRAKRYNIPNEIGQWGMYSLVRMAVRENDLSAFNLLMTEFENRGFIENLQGWQIQSFVNFLSENNKYGKAIELYNTYIKNNPNDASAHNSLGKAYLKNKNQKMALKHLKKAITLAKKNNDEHLDRYTADLNLVNKH